MSNYEYFTAESFFICPECGTTELPTFEYDVS